MVGASCDTGVRSEQESGGLRSPARWNLGCKGKHSGESSQSVSHVNSKFHREQLGVHNGHDPDGEKIPEIGAHDSDGGQLREFGGHVSADRIGSVVVLGQRSVPQLPGAHLDSSGRIDVEGNLHVSPMSHAGHVMEPNKGESLDTSVLRIEGESRLSGTAVQPM